MAIQYCPNCGANLSHTSHELRLCPSCGKPLESNTQPSPTHIHVHVGRGPFNKWVTFLLWLFLGFLGAHKFYEGKVFMGIIYALTLGLFGFGLFFDFFAILFKPTEYYLP
ncbi:MAG: NINE protein [Erysipelothrix sp.]|jgi:hypothetical protein|nr:NINE protein [Erysipelothrix sp.]